MGGYSRKLNAQKNNANWFVRSHHLQHHLCGLIVKIVQPKMAKSFKILYVTRFILFKHILYLLFYYVINIIPDEDQSMWDVPLNLGFIKSRYEKTKQSIVSQYFIGSRW